MMTDDILNGIKIEFDNNPDLYLLPQSIYTRMYRKGFFRDVKPNEAIITLQIYLESTKYFTNKHPLDGKIGDGWALKSGFHSKDQENWDVTPLQVGEKPIQRTISPDGSEIKNGTIPLLGDFYRFFFSMDTYQQRQWSIDIRYYASENATCKIEQDDHEHWFLKSAWLRDWYKENRIEPGDKIWLVTENIIPLVIRIYTEWERNPDTYRRYKLRQESNPLHSVALPIWQLIRDVFEQTQKIAHRLDIWNAVREKRPEISEQSVYACLSANPYLFIRVGEGGWGLKEWGLEEVEAAVRPVGSTLEENPNLPTESVSIDYILANIASEDLVYRILQESPKPLTVTEITERISKILHVNKDVLARTNFFDPSDPRFNRQEDGTFTLRKKLEELQDGIRKLSEQARETKVSLEEEINSLKTKIESATVQHQKQLKQIEEERDTLQKIAEEWIGHHEEINNQREKRIQLMSEFLAEAIPHIGQDKLKEIFEHLHQKSEFRNMIDSGEIIKFSKIVRKFLPRLQD